MCPTPRLELRFYGGPFDGCLRTVFCVPYELATPIALPYPQRELCRENRNLGPEEPDTVAIYQLNNNNGDWQYDYLWTTTATAMGLEEEVDEATELEDMALDACEAAMVRA